MSFDNLILKAVDTQTGSGFPEAPEPVVPGKETINPAERDTAPQTMSLAEAAQKNYVKRVQNESTGNENYVINHGRLHSNGYRLLKEGKEVRSRVISVKNEQLYTLEADPKLIGSAPTPVKEDFAADPTNPERQAQPASRSALEEAKDYIQDLVDQGLLGEKIDQKSLENYAQAVAGMLPVQSDGTNPNNITVELLRKKIEENSGTEIASALFNIDPEDPNHVDIDKFVAQIRQKRKIEEQSTGKKEEKPTVDKDSLEKAAKEVIPAGFIVFGINNPKDFRKQKMKFYRDGNLQMYESMGHNFVNRMLAVQFKYLGIPIANVDDFFDAIGSKDSVGNFTHFEFVKNTFLKLGYNPTDAGKKAEYYLNILADQNSREFYSLTATGLNFSALGSVNLYKTLDVSINADQLYAQAAIDASLEVEQAEDPQQVEKEKVVALKESLNKQYLTDEEMEYGILHILQKPIGYKHLTLDMDRVESLEEHISRKTILSMKNDGILDIFFREIEKIETISTDEISGKFDIQPSTLKHVDVSIEEAKNTLFKVITQTPTGPKINPQEYAEHTVKLYLAKLRVQILQDLKAMGMKPTTFDKEKIRELIEARKQSRLSSKSKGLLDWANGDVDPNKDYPMVTDSGIAERQQQLANVFEKPADFRRAEYEKLKEKHKQVFMGNIGQPKTPVEEGTVTPQANDGELSAEISNAVESSLQGKDLNVLKLSKDLIYEINNTFTEMSQIKDNESELENKRNILEKFLSSRGLTPSGAKAAAEAVFTVIKGTHSGGLPVGSGSERPQQKQENASAQPVQQELPSIEKVMQSLEAKGVRKIPKGVQGNLARLKAYLDINNAGLTENEIQMLFTQFNPPKPQFSFEDYAKQNPNRFIERNGKFYIVFDGKEVPVPENIKNSEEAINSFIGDQEAKEKEIKAQKLQQVSEKVKDLIARIDSVGKFKRQNKKELIQQLVEAGMSEAEASLMVETLLREKIPVLQAKVQAKVKGLENSAKVRNIFTSDGKSLTADEISTNISGLSAAVLSEISDYFIDDKEALEAAEKIVIGKYQQAVQAEKLVALEEQLGIKAREGKPGTSGELDLVVNGNPTKVKVKKAEDLYILTSSDGAEIQIPQKELLAAGQVNYDLIAQQLESLTPTKVESTAETAVENKEAVEPQDDGAIAVQVKNGKLTNAKDLASNIVGSILSGKPVRLSSPITRLDEKSWFDLVDAISKSKAFKKLKLPPEAAEDIVFQITSAPDDQLEFDLSNMLKAETSKSIFNVMANVITKTVDSIMSQDTLSDMSIVLVVENYIDSLQQAGMFSEDNKAQFEMLINDLLVKNKISEESSNKLLDKISQTF